MPQQTLSDKLAATLTPETLRVHMGETVNALQLCCSSLCDFLELADDTGTAYVVSKISAYCRQLERTAALLRPLKPQLLEIPPGVAEGGAAAIDAWLKAREKRNDERSAGRDQGQG